MMNSVNSLRRVSADSHALSRRGALALAIPIAAQEASPETNEGIVRKHSAASTASPTASPAR